MICFNIEFDININVNIESTLSDLMDDYFNQTLILSQFYLLYKQNNSLIFKF
jgi:hypothetical protein